MIYDLQKAHDVARQLQDGDSEGWRYVVEPSNCSQFGKVQVLDETGYFVGYWGNHNIGDTTA